MRRGGILRVAVPDFEGLIRGYQKTRNTLEIQGPLFGFFEITTEEGDKKMLYHKIIYDFKLLKRVLEENGFTDIRRYDWRHIVPEGEEDHSMAYIPSRDYTHGIPVSLNVEARKAGNFVKTVLKVAHLIDKTKRKLKKKFIR